MNRLREIRSFRENQSLREGESERIMEEPKWIDEKEVARITGIALSTLRNWRHRGVGFPYYKGPGGRMVRYLLDDVIWIMSDGKVDPRD